MVGSFSEDVGLTRRSRLLCKRRRTRHHNACSGERGQGETQPYYRYSDNLPPWFRIVHVVVTPHYRGQEGYGAPIYVIGSGRCVRAPHCGAPADATSWRTTKRSS